MKKCKITVLKTTFDKELADEYGVEGLGPCPFLKVGQTFYADWECPQGFCNERRQTKWRRIIKKKYYGRN